MRFNKLGLKNEILEAVADLGFEYPTPVQEKVIPELLEGNADLVGLAETGTGKTAAFGLPMLQRIDFHLRAPQGLVLCPTRELCLQIVEDLKRYARYLEGANIVAVYGGASIGDQIRLLKKGAHIIVATPGRCKDLMDRKAVQLEKIAFVVLDEADEMLDMGFKEDLDAILGNTPKDKRTWLFSATMPKEAEKIAEDYMTVPVRVTSGVRNRGPASIKHICYLVPEKDRYSALKRIIDFEPDIFALIFCRTRNETRIVAQNLINDGYNAEALHGELSQEQRNQVMGKFRERTLKVLVATDVAARGLDVDDISHVIHYTMPDEADRYTHRSGRTARAGKTGISMVLATSREMGRIKQIMHQLGVSFQFGGIPTSRAICEKQLYSLVDRMVNVQVNEQEIEKYLPPVYEALESFTKEELIQRFVSAEFNRFLDYYRHLEDIPVCMPKPEPGSRKKRMVLRKNTQRFFVNVGRLDKIKEKSFFRLVCKESGVPMDKLSGLALKREFSFFDVEKSVAQKVLKSLKGLELGGRKITARFADQGAKASKAGKQPCVETAGKLMVGKAQ